MNLLNAISLLMVMTFFGSKAEIKEYNISDGILISNVTVITANAEGTIISFDGFVLIEGNSIVYVGNSRPKVSGNVKLIDGREKYIIPGLIDSHVHLANMAGFTWRHEKKYPKLVNEYFKQLPKSFLYYGFTTLIDVNPFDKNVIRRIKKYDIRPDIYSCGEQIKVMNDFMMVMDEMPMKKRLKTRFLYDKYNNNLLLPDSIDLKPHSTKAIINNISEEKESVCVKTLYEDETSGFPLLWEKPSLKLIKDVVKESHQKNLTVLLHGTSYEAQKFGLEAGVDVFAHSLWNWYQEPKNFLNSTFKQEHKDLLGRIADRKIGYQLTFRTIYGEVDLLKEGFFEKPELKNVLPREYINWLNSEEGNWGKQKILNRGKIIKRINPKLYKVLRSNFESDELMFRGIQDVLKTRMNVVAKFMSDKNANLLFATDGVAMNMATNPPGYNGFLELNHWYNAGVSLENIFRAATYNNAKTFRIDNAYGSISEGKIANLLLLNKNPLKDISAYDTVETVFLRGKTYARKDLIAQHVNRRKQN